jgi:hypothetical protein
VIPKRYLIATLFIAAMLVILSVVQAPRAKGDGGVISGDAPVAANLASFETIAQYELQEGWVPRFQNSLDPDQADPWPFGAGFNTPWEPASPYLSDQGLALNGPDGKSEVVLWQGLEWRHYRFDAPLCSARLDPAKGRHLLVTLRMGTGRFETRLLEVPEGRVLWVSDSGPWSRFSWDGKSVLLGLEAPPPLGALLLSSRTAEKESTDTTLAPWDEKALPPPPKGWMVKPDQLWDDGKDLPGERLLIPWQSNARFWFPTKDRLWVSEATGWTLWALEDGIWHRREAGAGVLMAHPPLAMGLVALDKEGSFVRESSPLDRVAWDAVSGSSEPWPAYDPAWVWYPNGAISAKDDRWGSALPGLQPERQREALSKSFRAEWRVAAGLRASVQGWLPNGPEVAMREAQTMAWVWVGNRVLMVRLQSVGRLRQIKALLK